MRCTKCNYLSFEPEPRCRNCGHDLSLDDLSQDEGGIDRADASRAAGAAAFNLADATLAGLGDPEPSLLEAPGMSVPRPAARKNNGAAPPTTSEFPLFARSLQSPPAGQASADGAAVGLQDVDEELEPLVTVPPQPRTPIAVRRPTPDAGRSRARHGAAAPREADLLDQMDAADDLPLTAPVHEPQWTSEPTPERLPEAWLQKVGGFTRLAAALIDAALLGAIAAAVMFCTLRLVGLPLRDVGLLPFAPLATLFLLFAAGYELLFTAACGQTVGKMAMGIRVVGTSSEAVINDHVTVGQAALRSIAALPSVLVLGVGFLPALVGAGLAVHDRVARTRVVYS